MLGPFHPSDPLLRRRGARINPVFTVSKPDGDVRPVINYSKRLNDGGPSLNERIKEGPRATVEYLQMTEIIYTILAVGEGAMVWAKDLQEGYYNVRVREDQVWLLAFQFMGMIFVPMVLAMGLSSAPLIFTIFMSYIVSAILLMDDNLMWVSMPLSQFDRSKLHVDSVVGIDRDNDVANLPLILFYLDDIFGIAHRDVIWRQYRLAGEMLVRLGQSTKVEKDRKPSDVQILLGIEYVIPRQTVRTPREKALRYIAFANLLLSKKSVLKKELFSLTGKARHIALYCRPLAAFARGVEIHGLLTVKGRKVQWHHHITMTRRLRADVEMLRNALQFCLTYEMPWSFILHPSSRAATEIDVFTDAAGVHGGIGGFVAEQNSRYFFVQNRFKKNDQQFCWLVRS